jgi:hypothetical protein
VKIRKATATVVATKVYDGPAMLEAAVTSKPVADRVRFAEVLEIGWSKLPTQKPSKARALLQALSD